MIDPQLLRSAPSGRITLIGWAGGVGAQRPLLMVLEISFLSYRKFQLSFWIIGWAGGRRGRSAPTYWFSKSFF